MAASSGAPKFPNVPVLELLWRAYLRTGMQQFLSLTLVTLDNMGRGGIYDHVGGGFARYAIDDQWLIPHFEKMLYDNAQLLDIMTLVWQHGKQPVLRAKSKKPSPGPCARCGWRARASPPASMPIREGEEGKFYVWNEAEIDEVLAGTAVDRFKQAYGVTREGNFSHEGKPSGRNILHRIANLPGWTEAEEPNFAEQRQRLFAARESRVRPGRDDKVLVDWNGLMIASIANAGAAFDRPDWIEAARHAFQFVCERLGEGDRLFHSYRDGKSQHPAFADGYAAHGARRARALGSDPERTISSVPSPGPAPWTRNSGTWCRAAMSTPATPICPSRCAPAMPSTPRHRRATPS